MPYIVSAIFLIYLHSTYGVETPLDLGNVVLTNVVFRHGNRTPIDFYVNDPYNEPSVWPTGFGQLLEEGMRGHFALGLWLRDRYSTFLPIKYDRNDLYIRSTDVDRTLMSAQCNLAGLYEPDPAKNWSPSIRWQPIPIHTLPEAQDEVLAGKKKCPRYDALYAEALNAKPIQDTLKKNQKLLDALTAASGQKISTLRDVEYLFDTLFIEQTFGLKLPNWTEEVYPQPMEPLAGMSFEVASYNREMARLKIGPLFKEMVMHMDAKIKKKMFEDVEGKNPIRKMYMYSAHDTTVGNILQALDIYNGLPPPYFSTILLELREKQGVHFITFYFKNSTQAEPYLLSIPGCAALCPYDHFKELVLPLLPDDWDTECQTPFSFGLYHISMGISGFIALGACIILLFAVIMNILSSKRNGKTNIVYQGLATDVS